MFHIFLFACKTDKNINTVKPSINYRLMQVLVRSYFLFASLRCISKNIPGNMGDIFASQIYLRPLTSYKFMSLCVLHIYGF